MESGLNLFQIINRGAIATYPLIVLSILSVAVILERLWSLRNAGGSTEKLGASICDSIRQGRQDLAMAVCRQNQELPAARLFLAALTQSGSDSLERSTALMNEAIY